MLHFYLYLLLHRWVTIFQHDYQCTTSMHLAVTCNCIHTPTPLTFKISSRVLEVNHMENLTFFQQFSYMILPNRICTDKVVCVVYCIQTSCPRALFLGIYYIPYWKPHPIPWPRLFFHLCMYAWILSGCVVASSFCCKQQIALLFLAVHWGIQVWFYSQQFWNGDYSYQP